MNDKKGTKESCTCRECRTACKYKPGWFIPGEAEKVAPYLNIELKELFDTKLMIDWWCDYPKDIFLLSPAIINEDAGQEFTADPKGQWVFYKKGLCEIHPVKPFECKESLHNIESFDTHKNVANKWKNNQQQIKNLLDREPVSKSYYGF